MKKSWRTIHNAMLAPAYMAIGFAWLAVILHVVIGRVIVRETTAGGFLAQQIERLPSSLAKPVFTLLWYLFFLGGLFP